MNLFKNCQKFYIDGNWCAPSTAAECDIINPSDETVLARLALGAEADVNRAVAAAKQAFTSFSRTNLAERLELLESILACYQKHSADMAEAISLEMGAPLKFAIHGQTPCGSGHISEAINSLKTFQFQQDMGHTRIQKEAIGVCALITPWNWPINQIACKVAPAIACGCTTVLKPSEIAPLSALLFAEILHEAGTPSGVFNLVNGTGPEVGQALAAHLDVDMISITGSTRAGISVAKVAACTVKRVSQELGGKSPFIILDDADLNAAVKNCCQNLFLNSGQSCDAPSRLLVPEYLQAEAIEIARQYAESLTVGCALAANVKMGPVVSQGQFDKVQKCIKAGIEAGATLVCGGLGKPTGMDMGYFVKPTVFADVDNRMSLAREEIFGPVLSILPYKNERDAIAIGNDTPYGLAAYIHSASLERARNVAAQLRVGMVHINGADIDFCIPFGGYKQSGNGREWGAYGFEDYLETKAIMGYSN